jgi:hypothetical protein
MFLEIMPNHAAGVVRFFSNSVKSKEPLKNAVPISEKRDAIENRERAIPT